MTDADCVFCGIVAGDADALVVEARDGDEEQPGTLAFSPLDPIAPGHVLVIPTAHHETLFDVPEDVLAAVMEHTRSLASRMRGDGNDECGFDGVNVLNDSTSYQSVPHLHVHLVGRHEDDRDLFPDSDYDGSKRDAHDAVVSAIDGA
ncbi:HIT family protein [Halorubellus sp. JP-L1]|uniref:HIT family protein n=1 Tax=Halorubellus sp. JP-L1 TaxID=2715753 RepID=UPI001408C0AA|nr:HIT family protein [Halorubellus sp. JP-L1]NHN42579.1 HIT family protein [Halorubellus sp. JP-L1]